MLRIFREVPPLGSHADTILAVHPTQLYETVFGFLMFLFLWRLRDHRHLQGWLFGLYCVLAGMERFLIEFVRVEPDRLSVGLPIAQVVALAITATGGLLMYARRAPTEQPPRIKD
jgi:phosphatidylglycerol:prolipoprotein diacylglycerol transferase